MTRSESALYLFVLFAFLGSNTVVAQPAGHATDDWVELDPEYVLYVYVPDGRIDIVLSKDFAQAHVERVKSLAREGYYEGIPFLRVIPGYISQATDPFEFDLAGYTRRPFRSESVTIQGQFDRELTAELEFVALREPDEFQEQEGYVHGFPVMRNLDDGKIWMTGCPGAVGMPRDIDPNSGTTGFWIAHQSMRQHDRNHTVFGRVVAGMQHALLMPPASAEDASTWTVIDSVRVAADLPVDHRTNYRMRNTNADSFAAHVDSLRNPDTEWYQTLPRRLDVCYSWIVPVEETGRGD